MAWEKFKYAETDTVLPAKILLVDELAQFIGNPDRKEMRLADKMSANMQQIAQLGRSAHIHMVLATQSASGNLFPSSLKNNIAQRCICGRVEANISRMAIDSEEGESLPLTPGSYLGYSKGTTQQLQGWYTPTKAVLALGTVKDGYDNKTGLQVDGDSFDMSPVEDIVEEQEDDSEELLDNLEQVDEEDEKENDDLFDDSFDDIPELGELIENDSDDSLDGLDKEDNIEQIEQEDKPKPKINVKINKSKNIKIATKIAKPKKNITIT